VKQTPEARLILAQVVLARLREEGDQRDAIAFWEQAVAECEAEVEKPD
jgi:hypothetical protein